MTHTKGYKKRILLVEDEPVISRLCAKILTSEGFDVDVERDGRNAKEAANNKNYDVCVSDIRLPGLTGIQLHELFKANQPQLAQRMLFMTGDTMNANVQSFLQESGIPCLMKPFSPEDLITAVRHI